MEILLLYIFAHLNVYLKKKCKWLHVDNEKHLSNKSMSLKSRKMPEQATVVRKMQSMAPILLPFSELQEYSVHVTK